MRYYINLNKFTVDYVVSDQFKILSGLFIINDNNYLLLMMYSNDLSRVICICTLCICTFCQTMRKIKVKYKKILIYHISINGINKLFQKILSVGVVYRGFLRAQLPLRVVEK